MVSLLLQGHPHPGIFQVFLVHFYIFFCECQKLQGIKNHVLLPTTIKKMELKIYIVAQFIS